MTDTVLKAGCKATNRAGYPCRHPVVLPSGLCPVHDAESDIAKRFMAGPEHTKGPGRPPKPAAPDVLREMVERELEVWLAPYREAVTSAVLSATYEGNVIASNVPDVGARISAAEKVLNRTYGMPKQAVDVDHTSGGKTLDQLFAPTPLAQTNTLLPAGDEPAGWEGTT